MNLACANRSAPRSSIPDRERLAAESLLRTWARAGRSAITVLSEGRTVLEPWRHYPEADLRDPASALRLYYHCHSRPRARQVEHGHFHVFLETAAADGPEWSHLVAIGLDAYGLPVRLFTVNRWVTAERWLPAAILERRLRRLLEIEDYSIADSPDAQIIVFVRALLRIFEPQICKLLARRDACARGWGDSDFEDRRRVVLSGCAVSLFDPLSSSAGRSP